MILLAHKLFVISSTLDFISRHFMKTTEMMCIEMFPLCSLNVLLIKSKELPELSNDALLRLLSSAVPWSKLCYWSCVMRINFISLAI